MADTVAAFALARVGEGYIYGARGQRCTPAFRAQQAAQYPEHAKNILETGARWDGRPVWDCAQLTRYAARAAGYDLPSGATSQWTKAAWKATGGIAELPEGQTVFLYRRSGGRMQHTGIALGDGTCVHAKSTADGVIRQKMSGYGWTHWGTLTPIPTAAGQKEETDMTHESTVTAENGLPVFLRTGPGAKNDYIARVPVGTTVKVLGTAADAQWTQVQVDGKTGYMMTRYLTNAGSTEPPTGILLHRALAQELLDALLPQLGKG